MENKSPENQDKKEDKPADTEGLKDGEETLKDNVAAVTKTPSAKTGEKKSEKNSKKKGKRRHFKDSSGKKGRVHVDILGETAMDNALYICHSVQELLFWRGYQWIPGSKKQKKKGKK